MRNKKMLQNFCATRYNKKGEKIKLAIYNPMTHSLIYQTEYQNSIFQQETDPKVKKNRFMKTYVVSIVLKKGRYYKG